MNETYSRSYLFPFLRKVSNYRMSLCLYVSYFFYKHAVFLFKLNWELLKAWWKLEKNLEDICTDVPYSLLITFPQKLFISPEFTKHGNKTAAECSLYPQMELSSYIQSICIFKQQVHFLYAEWALKCTTATNCD